MDLNRGLLLYMRMLIFLPSLLSCYCVVLCLTSFVPGNEAALGFFLTRFLPNTCIYWFIRDLVQGSPIK